jgi:hypothetical protein
VIRRRAREWKAERDVYRASERRNLDRRHADIVIRRDHGIELTSHGSHEDSVGRIRPSDSSLSGRRREKLGVFAPEPAAVARMGI